uniref:Disease resistance N-terminal domain-containing protein n=1 Tax=Oryza meridionalis TaxID=40149 RepID=A0A0E0C7B9_9ORYZ
MYKGYYMSESFSYQIITGKSQGELVDLLIVFSHLVQQSGFIYPLEQQKYSVRGRDKRDAKDDTCNEFNSNRTTYLNCQPDCSPSSYHKNLTMDTIFSAVLGDLFSRSISFVIDIYHHHHQGGVEENLQQLHRMLLRIQAVVEEADSRCITNQAMLLQLRMLRDVMFRGYYFVDNFRYRIFQAQAKDEVGDHSLDLPPFNPLERFFISTRASKIASEILEKKELQKMLGRLETIVSDMQEFVVLSSSYPRITRQPYCSYVLLENCMFGRHAELERVIKFLLEQHPLCGAKGIDVLPITGPGRVGKSTLVEHVCRDERIESFGTTKALQLDFLPKEAFWYLFKTVAFGSTNPEDPKLASICMEIADLVNGSFMESNVVGSILRSNLSAQFWYNFLKRLKYFTDRHFRLLGEHPRDSYKSNRGRTYIWMHKNYYGDSDAATYNLYHANSAGLNNLPMLRMSDMLIGNVKPQKKCEALEWQSSIPPYYSYIVQYEILARQPLMLPKRKRSRALLEELLRADLDRDSGVAMQFNDSMYSSLWLGFCISCMPALIIPLLQS